MLPKTLKAAGMAAMAMIAIGGAANATQATYTDKASFIAAAGPLTFESFEAPISFTSTGVAPTNRNLTDATFPNVDVTCAQPSCVFGYDNTGILFPTDGVAAVYGGGLVGTTFNFAHPIKAFGIDMIGAGTAGFPTDLSFVAANNTHTLYTGVFSNDFSNVLFGGLTNTKGFTHVSIYGTDGVDFIGYDSLRFSSSLAAVPEPNAWIVMLVGLGAIGAIGRRRQASMVSS